MIGSGRKALEETGQEAIRQVREHEFKVRYTLASQPAGPAADGKTYERDMVIPIVVRKTQFSGSHRWFRVVVQGRTVCVEEASKPTMSKQDAHLMACTAIKQAAITA